MSSRYDTDGSSLEAEEEDQLDFLLTDTLAVGGRRDAGEMDYKTRGGETRRFQTSLEACALFGFYSGQRVHTKRGPAWVVGVEDKDQYLHVDGDAGASRWPGSQHAKLKSNGVSVLHSNIPEVVPHVPKQNSQADFFKTQVNNSLYSDIVIHLVANSSCTHSTSTKRDTQIQDAGWPCLDLEMVGDELLLPQTKRARKTIPLSDPIYGHKLILGQYYFFQQQQQNSGTSHIELDVKREQLQEVQFFLYCEEWHIDIVEASYNEQYVQCHQLAQQKACNSLAAVLGVNLTTSNVVNIYILSRTWKQPIQRAQCVDHIRVYSWSKQVALVDAALARDVDNHIVLEQYEAQIEYK